MVREIDPTRLTPLRNRLKNDIKTRFGQLRSWVKRQIMDQNALGLLKSFPGVEKDDTRKYEYTLSSVNVFRDKLIHAIKSVLTLDWDDTYIIQAYDRGVKRAFEDDRQATPISKDYQKGVYDLYSDIHQVSGIQSKEVLSVRADAMLEGMNATLYADLSKLILDGVQYGSSRSKILALLMKRITTHIHRIFVAMSDQLTQAHAEGQLDGLKVLGKTHVRVLVEWLTVGDNRVCKYCKKMEKQVFTIAAARGMLPAHHNCFHKNTRILTNQGWKVFQDLDQTELFYTRDFEKDNYDLNQFEYVKAKNWIKYYYKGDLLQFSGKNIGEFCVTPDHELILGQYVGCKKLKQLRIKAEEFENIIKDHNELYFALIEEKGYAAYDFAEYDVKKIEYDDFVYCVELEKCNNILVKGNSEIPVWSGNCRCAWQTVQIPGKVLADSSLF
jgi:thioredoxin-related protein